MKNFGAWIVRERTKYGLTQQELADAIGTSVQTLSSWESGSRTPQPANLEKVSRFFELAGQNDRSARPAPVRKLPSSQKVSLNLGRLKSVTIDNVAGLVASAPHYPAPSTRGEFTRLVENTVGAIHQIPGFVFRSTRKKYELKQIEAYFGRSSGAAVGEANLYGRFQAGIARGHTHGFVLAVTTIKGSLAFERHGIRLLDVLKESDGLCISNTSLNAVGRVGKHEPGYLYVTFRLLEHCPELARELTREEIEEIVRRMQPEFGYNIDGLQRGLETANDPSYPGSVPLKHADLNATVA
jgi:transcriptional regulator with XRE-family HTH domain